MSTAAEHIALPGDRRSHSSAVCMRLLRRFMIQPYTLRSLVKADRRGPAFKDYLSDRDLVERLAGALWGVFSHSRAVVDSAGRHFDLGSWRSAGELIADLANAHNPTMTPPIRYLDCYMGVMLGDERAESARPLYRWIFSQLHASGCDWIYSFSPELAEERRARRRELSVAFTQAYEDSAPYGTHAPPTGVIAAYHEVYGQLPEGWPG